MSPALPARRRRPPAVLLAFVLGAGGSPPAAAFLDGPPARVTGGFGEDSCESCHFGHPENDADGMLRLHGWPAGYEAGRTYELRVELSRPRMQAAGFQLAMRHADERQAGDLSLPEGEDDRAQVVESRGIRFAQHAQAGSRPGKNGVALWTLLWTAPDRGGSVHVHVAAVAADGDESQAGDFVYTLEAESAPAND